MRMKWSDIHQTHLLWNNLPVIRLIKVFKAFLADPIVVIVSGVPFPEDIGKVSRHKFGTTKLAMIVVPIVSCLDPGLPAPCILGEEIIAGRQPWIVWIDHDVSLAPPA